MNRGWEESSQIERKKKKKRKDQREREIQTDTEIWGKKTQQKKGEKKGVWGKEVIVPRKTVMGENKKESVKAGKLYRLTRKQKCSDTNRFWPYVPRFNSKNFILFREK